MLRLLPSSSAAPDLSKSLRGVFFQGAFPDRRILVAYDHAGTLRRKVEVAENDMEPDEERQMWAWLDRHDPA